MPVAGVLRAALLLAVGAGCYDPSAAPSAASCGGRALLDEKFDDPSAVVAWAELTAGASVDGGALVLALPAGAAFRYEGLTARAAIDLRGTRLAIELEDVPTLGPEMNLYFGAIAMTGSDSAYAAIYESYVDFGGGTFTRTGERFVGLAERGGLLGFQVSSDGAAWGDSLREVVTPSWWGTAFVEIAFEGYADDGSAATVRVAQARQDCLGDL